MEFREITERYRLEKILKSSKSGTVLRAADGESGRTVVVKLIPVGSAPNLEGRMGAFNRLAAAIGALGHPALPVVLDSGITPDGSAFLVMEHLDGRGLDTLAGVAPSRALPLLMQAVSGLEALAGQRVPYLNLSPDNVLVIPGPAGDPVGEQAKLLGLGTVLFQPVGGPGDEGRRFRAPELLSPQPGERADARADLYSLGVASCHVLGATIAPAAANGADPGVQMPLALSFELENAEALRQMLERCLRRRPAERPAHQAVRYAFQLALEGAESPLWQPAVPAPAEILQAPRPVEAPPPPVPVSAPVAAAPLPRP
ncbi:MAG TPA: hypothetical protein VEL74_05645 [Thermoanaerobaculia bacterium]|nr:hypothetical protein [Thermoanaerobaculia bacterium]